MNSKIVRAAFMTGARVPLFEIARHLDEDAATVRAWLVAHGIAPESARGPCVNVVMPVEAFLPDLDSVGAGRRMSRDQVAAEILRIVMSGGADCISEILDRGICGA